MRWLVCITGTYKFFCLFQEVSILQTINFQLFDHYFNREEQYMAKPPSPFNSSGSLGIEEDPWSLRDPGWCQVVQQWEAAGWITIHIWVMPLGKKRSLGESATVLSDCTWIIHLWGCIRSSPFTRGGMPGSAAGSYSKDCKSALPDQSPQTHEQPTSVTLLQ